MPLLPCYIHNFIDTQVGEESTERGWLGLPTLCRKLIVADVSRSDPSLGHDRVLHALLLEESQHSNQAQDKDWRGPRAYNTRRKDLLAGGGSQAVVEKVKPCTHGCLKFVLLRSNLCQIYVLIA